MPAGNRREESQNRSRLIGLSILAWVSADSGCAVVV